MSFREELEKCALSLSFPPQLQEGIHNGYCNNYEEINGIYYCTFAFETTQLYFGLCSIIFLNNIT